MRTSVIFLICVLIAPVGAVDFLRDSKTSIITHSETHLSGVDLRENVNDAARTLGKPTRVVLETSPEPGPYSARIYEWETNNYRLRIITLSDGRIEQIDLWGHKCNSNVCSTGKGLRLGETRTAAQDLYAGVPTRSTFLRRDLAFPDCPLQRSNLRIDFDQADHVTHMSLSFEKVYCY